MQTLETLYETTFKNNTFFDRKINIQNKKTILYGPRKSGKSHLLIDHLRHYEKGTYLYIDFLDSRIDTALVGENLPLFIKKHSIKLLIIEHFDFSFELPNVEEIVIATNLTCKELRGFTKLTLYPLDFEEFIAFDKKHSNIEHLFNLFANNGTFPQIIQYQESDSYKAVQEMLHIILLDNSYFLIYKKLCELQGTKISLFQVYNALKATMKISKDKLYAITNELINEKLLFLVEKYAQSNASKKVFLIDFTFKNALSFKKDFIRQFENMVFLELVKRHEKIFYEEGIDFYIPEESLAVLCVGFATKEMIEKKLQKLLPTFWALHVKRIEVVTLSSESAQDIEGLSFLILPFWEWSLQL